MSALVITGLTKSFGGLRVTNGVDLAVAPGERRLIIGPNGAGKTTLFNLITGELAPDAGAIALFGEDITRTPCRRHVNGAAPYVARVPGEFGGHGIRSAMQEVGHSL